MTEDSILLALFTSYGVTISWLLYAITNIACAFFVYQDAIKQNKRALNIGSVWWGFFSLLGGVWTLLAYWFMQHSSLAKPNL